MAKPVVLTPKNRRLLASLLNGRPEQSRLSFMESARSKGWLSHQQNRWSVAVTGLNGQGAVGVGKNLPKGQQDIIKFYETNKGWERRHPEAFRHPPLSKYQSNPQEYMRNWIIAEYERLEEVVDDMRTEMRKANIPVPP
jgi:hypothetical protein